MTRNERQRDLVQALNGADISLGSTNVERGYVTESLNTTQVRPTGRLGQHTMPIGGGQSVGTISLEIDDHRTGTYTEAYPDLKDRGLPWAIAAYTPRVGVDADSVTWEEMIEMYADGAEIGLHPAGIDVLQDSEDEIYDFLISERNDLQDRGVYCDRVVFSGTPDFNRRSDWESFGGRLLLGAFSSVANHGLEWYKGTSNDNTDLSQQIGAGGGMWQSRYLIGNKDYLEVQDIVDNVANSGANLTLYWHPPNIDTSGHLTRTELRTILNDIEQKRNDGELNVVTPTTAQYLVGDARDNHVNPYPSFEKSSGLLSTSGAQPSKWRVDSGSTTINSTTARTGSNSLEIAPDESAKYKWVHPSTTPHFVIEGYARAKGTGNTATLRTDIGIRVNNDYPDLDSFFEPGRRNFSLDDTWSKFVTTASTHYEFPAEQIALENQSSSDAVLVDDVYIYPA